MQIRSPATIITTTKLIDTKKTSPLEDDGFGDLVSTIAITKHQSKNEDDDAFGDFGVASNQISLQKTPVVLQKVEKVLNEDEDDFGSFSAPVVSVSRNQAQHQPLPPPLKPSAAPSASILDSDPLSFSLSLGPTEKERQLRSTAPLNSQQSFHNSGVSALPLSTFDAQPSASGMDFFASLIEPPPPPPSAPTKSTSLQPQSSLISTTSSSQVSQQNLDDDDFGDVVSPEQATISSSLSINLSKDVDISANPIAVSVLPSVLPPTSLSSLAANNGGIKLKRGDFASSFTSSSSYTKPSPLSISKTTTPSSQTKASLHNESPAKAKTSHDVNVAPSLSSSSSFFSDEFEAGPSVPKQQTKQKQVVTHQQQRSTTQSSVSQTLSLSDFIGGTSIDERSSTLKVKADSDDQVRTDDLNFSSLKSAEVLFQAPPRVPDRAGDDEIVIAISTVSAGIDTVTSVVKEIQSALGLGSNSSAFSSSPRLLSIKSLDSALNRLVTADDLVTRALTALDCLPKSQATRKLRKDETLRASALAEMIDEAKAVAGSAKDEVLRLQKVKCAEKQTQVKSKAVNDLESLLTAPSVPLPVSPSLLVASPSPSFATVPSSKNRPALLRPPSSSIASSPRLFSPPVSTPSIFSSPKETKGNKGKDFEDDPFGAPLATLLPDMIKSVPSRDDDGFGDFETISASSPNLHGLSVSNTASSIVPPDTTARISPQQPPPSSPTLSIEDAFSHLDFGSVVHHPATTAHVMLMPETGLKKTVAVVEEDDDFGDFGTPSHQGAAISPPSGSESAQVLQTAPFTLVIEEEDKDDVEDFGDFSSPSPSAAQVINQVSDVSLFSNEVVQQSASIPAFLEQVTPSENEDDGFGDFDEAAPPPPPPLHGEIKDDGDFGDFDEAPQPVVGPQPELIHRRSSADEFDDMMNASNMVDLDIKLNTGSNILIKPSSFASDLNDKVVSISDRMRMQFQGMDQSGENGKKGGEEKNDDEGEDEDDEEDMFSELVATQPQSNLQESQEKLLFDDHLGDLLGDLSTKCASELKKLSNEKAVAIDEDRLEDALLIKKAVDSVKVRLASLETITGASYQVCLTSTCAEEISRIEIAIKSQSPNVNSRIVAAAAQSTALLFSWACTGGGCCRYKAHEDRISQQKSPSQNELPTFMLNAEKAVTVSKTWTANVRSLLEQFIVDASSSSTPSQGRDAIFNALSASAPTTAAFSNLASTLRACTNIAVTFFTARTLHRSCGKEAGIIALPVLSLETKLLELAKESNALVTSFPAIGLISFNSSGQAQSVTPASANRRTVSDATFELFVANAALVDAIQNKANVSLMTDSPLVRLTEQRISALDSWFSPYSPKSESGIAAVAIANSLLQRRGFTFLEDAKIEYCRLCGVSGEHNDCSSLLERFVSS